jgi:hypothetical protein
MCLPKATGELSTCAQPSSNIVADTLVVLCAAMCLQAYYLAAPLPCERAPMRPLRLKSSGSNGSNGASLAAAGDYHPVSISLLADYPVRGWVVEGPSLAGMAQVRGGDGGGSVVMMAWR